MITNNQIKFIRSLEQKKIRIDQGLFIAEGKKIVNEILNSSLKIRSLFATRDFNSLTIKGSEFENYEIDEKELERISFLSAPNEVLCVVEIPNHEIVFSELKQKLSLFLDNIKDPGNLGNIIRIADWFGIENIFCSMQCVDAYNPKVVQATMGSIARIKIFYVGGEHFIGELKKALPSTPLQKEKGVYKIFASTLKGKNIYNETLSKNGLIILGNESEGISENLIRLASERISIPPFGMAESLNVSASAAVICSEFRRRNLT